MMSGKPRHSHHDSTGYQPVHQQEAGEDGVELGDLSASAGAKRTDGLTSPKIQHTRMPPASRNQSTVLILTISLIGLLATNLYLALPYVWGGEPHGSDSNSDCTCSPKDVPQYFQTSPQRWAGVTATGPAPFMAQTRTFEPTGTYVPNEPLETSMPIEGMQAGNRSIFEMMGYLSPYTPSPGFGVDEYPMPPGAELVQVHMLSRHGSRYPTPGSEVEALGERLKNASSKTLFKGALGFLADWEYELGAAILVPKGREELFRSGILHNYMYGHLHDPNSKLIVRTTTQDRMLKSAENWLAGFFGLEWERNATIEVIIEQSGFNNSLAGSQNCPNAYTKSTGSEALATWVDTYLADATDRFQVLTEGFEWTASDVYAAQTMCPYETVSYGFSKFCDLFTYEEWQGFEYSIDLLFSGMSSFQSPTGRAVGIGYQQELLARLHNHTLSHYAGSQINITLDSNTETFPLNQSLYFDFSHDTNIISILAAFGLRQFADDLPTNHHPGDHDFTVSHLTPFGARLDIEIIKTHNPVSAARDGNKMPGGETKYVHFILNQRTIPLGRSFPECDANRRDGWCELETFMKLQDGMTAKAQFEHACFGDYARTPYGMVNDGVPR